MVTSCHKQIKKFTFSFPLSWQQQYIHSGQQVATIPLSNIVKFMSNANTFADAQNATRASQDKKNLFSTKDDSLRKKGLQKTKVWNTEPYKRSTQCT
jgi:hypothetical protein